MRRNATLLVGVIGLALTLGAGAAGAANIDCAASPVPGRCAGTEEAD